MQRKPRFLLAALAEPIRFLGLAFLAGALGALRGGTPSGALFRYAAAPQLLFAAAFFFLWYDGERYAAYRPLAIVGKLLGLAALPVLLPGLLRAASEGPADPRLVAVPAVLVLLLDLLGLAALLLPAAKAPGSGGRAPGSSGAPGDGSGGGPSADNAPRADNVPRGPEDIERVEA